MHDTDRLIRIAKALQEADGTRCAYGAAKAASLYLDIVGRDRIHENLSDLSPDELAQRAASPHFNSTIALTIAVEKLTREIVSSKPDHSYWQPPL
jgi:hypothetical protein